MEVKICSYTEKNIRLQLVRINDSGSSGPFLELRCNRKVLGRWFILNSDSILARYHFARIVNELVIMRDTSVLSKLT